MADLQNDGIHLAVGGERDRWLSAAMLNCIAQQI
jgi:hypothetical protein